MLNHKPLVQLILLQKEDQYCWQHATGAIAVLPLCCAALCRHYQRSLSHLILVSRPQSGPLSASAVLADLHLLVALGAVLEAAQGRRAAHSPRRLFLHTALVRLRANDSLGLPSDLQTALSASVRFWVATHPMIPDIGQASVHGE